ncbi:hypothetical protein [Gordonia soli]|nr:hypothetical protein [Gordonia soli]
MAFDKPPPTPSSLVTDAPPTAAQSDSVDELVAAYGELDAVLDRIAQLSADRCTDVEVVALAKANEVAGPADRLARASPLTFFVDRALGSVDRARERCTSLQYASRRGGVRISDT